MERNERIARVREMLERLRHRGPDGAVVWDGGEITLGVTRLAIVARDTEPRVLATEDGTIHAVVNGEIYNHLELGEALARRGHDTRSGPDTAVIPHLYEEEGTRLPERLDGMFAVALWDAKHRRLLLARDRAGEKPLFFAKSKGAIGFASEPGALLALPFVSRDPSPAGVLRYLTHGYFAGGDCAFANIEQLPPAHTLELGPGGERRTRYWRPWDGIASAPRIAPDDAPAAALTALEDAIASRVPGEVPFGVFLSGGVDSGLVVALASRRLGRRFPTFSLKLAGAGYDESEFARLTASAFGTEHHESAMDHADGEYALEGFAQGMDQPLGDPSLLPTWALARHAARHVPVVLTGEGGDELFAGYPTYLGHRYAPLVNRMPAAAGATLLAIARRLKSSEHHVSPANLIERFVGARGLSPLHRHHAWFGACRVEEAMSLLAPELARGLDARDTTAHLDGFAHALEQAGVLARDATPGLAVYQMLDFELYLGAGLLTKVDRCTMAHGVESRAPFLRPRLIEFAMALPEQAKLRGACGKWALKRAARGLLPDAILARRKQGFSPPFSAWARGPLSALIDERLSRDRVERAGVLAPAAVRRVLEDHQRGRAERGRLLWTILSLQMWAERWIMNAPPRLVLPPARMRAGVPTEPILQH
jgi:asparagine synthase (glutamine-hydrolysing)